MNRVIIMGSPRTQGRSAVLAEALFDACIDDFPEDELALVPVSELRIDPWGSAGWGGFGAVGQVRETIDDADAAGVADEADGAGDRGSSREAAEAAAVGPAAAGAAAPRVPAGGTEGFDGDERSSGLQAHDDMAHVFDALDHADELVVVCPVYFGGAPAQMKALLDRLHAYRAVSGASDLRRPLTLHVVGEEGFAGGFDALVVEVSAALSEAGFRLESVLNWVGCITEEGDIVCEPALAPLARGGNGATDGVADASVGKVSANSANGARDEGDEDDEGDGGPWFADDGTGSAARPSARPRLSIAGDTRGAAARAEARAQAGSRRSGSGGGAKGPKKKAGGAASGRKNSSGKRTPTSPRPANKGRGKRRG
ncbi:flavodoxin family protein [Eggerthellaceae bacterium zg-1084]|uniref:NAD(P)H-dependent oxidoreductase n=1 Tax=Berryella wangjianweii TaxID=2734634 RepID=UPI0015570AF4|nr:NAD(P)H-dependent oxidoreductase [Berryella wangjianweii]NPD30662.1 flavodoxin family protein [Berryella wangjianweii]